MLAGVREDQGAAFDRLAQHFFEERKTPSARHREVHGDEGGDEAMASFRFDHFRSAEHLRDEGVDRLGSGRGEEGKLPLDGAGLEDALDRREKALIEDLVGFVEDEKTHVGEIDQLHCHQLLEPSRGGDEHFEGTSHVLSRDLHRDPADGGPHPDASVVGEDFHRLRDLLAEVARGHKDDGARLSAFGHGVAAFLELLQLLQDGEGIGDRLAAAGLGDADDRFSAEEGGQGALLDLGGGHKTLGLQGGLERGDQVKGSKRRHVRTLARMP